MIFSGIGGKIMKPNIHDVAKVAGVSSTTVSRVLNNRGYISEKTKNKVYKAMEEINYFPNDLARSLFHKKTNLIGLIIPNSSNPFFGELAFHIESLNLAIIESSHETVFSLFDGLIAELVALQNSSVRKSRSFHFPAVKKFFPLFSAITSV